MPFLWADFPIQYIIPAIFLAIWALNQVFGREEAPAGPQRRNQPGPRPGGPNRAPRPLIAPDADREAETRWPDTLERDRPLTRKSSPTDEEVLVITDSRDRTRPVNRSGSEGGGRRQGRSRTAPAPAPSLTSPTRGGDASPARAVFGPLQSTLGRTVDSASSRGSIVALSPAEALAPQSEGYRVETPNAAELALNPAQLREALVLSELLQPPVTLRRARRR